jgi:hypothetical protein
MADKAQSNPLRRDQEQGYQADAVDPRKVWATVGVLLLTVLLCWGAIAWLVNFLETRHAAFRLPMSELEREHLLPPEPRLEAQPRLDGIRYRQQALQQLNSYGWVDQQQGIAHIPLKQAQQLILQQGWPEHDAGQPGERHGP